MMIAAAAAEEGCRLQCFSSVCEECLTSLSDGVTTSEVVRVV